jgi:hypothetical protein
MTLYFTEYLEKKCSQIGVSVLSIAKDMMMEDGKTNQSYIMDDIHVSQKAMPFILEKFKMLI